MTLMESKSGAVRRADFGLCEVKFAGDEGEDARTFEGYGAVFGNVDSYGDVIEKGAFRKTIAEAKKSGQWPAMLMQHGGWAMSADDLTPLGIWTGMEEDEKGLWVQGVLAETVRASEARALLKMTPRPALSGMSIGYRARKFTLGTKPDEPRRRLHEVELVEISLVTFPANLKARVTGVKSPDDIKTIRDFEAFLRDAGGFSHAAAKAIATGGFKATDPRDEDEADIAAQIRRNIDRLSKR